jgi:hypothetical protein
MTSLAMSLRDQNVNTIKQILRKGLDAAPGEVDFVLYSKTAYATSNKDVLSYAARLNSDFQVGKDLILATKSVMKKFAARDGNTFKPGVFKSTIACIIYQTTDNIAIKARSGMSKTVMVLVLCCLHKAKGNPVLVVLVKELLCEQFSLDNTLLRRPGS